MHGISRCSSHYSSLCPDGPQQETKTFSLSHTQMCTQVHGHTHKNTEEGKPERVLNDEF